MSKPDLSKHQVLGSLLFVVVVVLSGGIVSAADGWRWYTDPHWGYRVQYPANIFTHPDTAERRANLTLQNADGRARLLFFAGPNRLKLDTKGVAQQLAKADAGVVTYQRVAASWVVLSGYLGQNLQGTGTIFYERVNVSPDHKAMAGFRLEYPVELRREIDPLIARLGRSLTSPIYRDAASRQETTSDGPVSELPSLGSHTVIGEDPTDGVAGRHIARCRAKYPSYDEQTDTYRRFDGVRLPCDS